MTRPSKAKQKTKHENKFIIKIHAIRRNNIGFALKRVCVCNLQVISCVCVRAQMHMFCVYFVFLWVQSAFDNTPNQSTLFSRYNWNDEENVKRWHISDGIAAALFCLYAHVMLMEKKKHFEFWKVVFYVVRIQRRLFRVLFASNPITWKFSCAQLWVWVRVYVSWKQIKPFNSRSLSLHSNTHIVVVVTEQKRNDWKSIKRKS